MSEQIFLDNSLSKAEQYEQLIPQIKAVVAGETDRTANLANVASILKYSFNFLWVGFYIYNGEELVLNAFQGPLACTRIKVGKGVCGTSFEKRKSIIVPDVDKFEGHIACSSETKSEIVIPIFKNNEAIAVLDADSEILDFFDGDDQKYLEEIAKIISTIW